MIYLIGGAPRCGKTILAKSFSAKQKLSCISTDAIRPIILNSLEKSQRATTFPQTAMKAPAGKFRFDVFSSQAMLKAQLIEAKSMWPGTKAFISHLIGHGQDYVIEGVHLLPRFVNELQSIHGKNIKVIYLVKKDLASIIKGFSKNSSEYDWMYPSIAGDESRIRKAGIMVLDKSEYLYREAIKYNFKVVNTDTNFKQRLCEAQNYLLR